MTLRLRAIVPAIVVVLWIVRCADAATWYVAGNGVDGPDCGTKRNPCRSISRALDQPATVDGDKIVVGPGRYGDADDDGVLTNPGDETPAPGCGCILAINKSVSVTSSHGAAATVIGGRIVNGIAVTVALFMNGGEFGRPGKGFTVTNTKDFGSDGIVIDSANIAVRGNHVVNFAHGFGNGIATVAFPQPMLIEGNLVSGWEFGMDIRGGGAKTVRKNVVSDNITGMRVESASVVGNLAVANQVDGIWLRGAGSAVGNAAYGNRYGMQVQDFSGRVVKNNFSGNQFCGIRDNGVLPPPPVPNNHWGAATGPGPRTADGLCGSFDAVPFAASAFNVKPRFKP